MGIEKRKVTIGDHTYELTLFGAKQGQRILRILFRILGAATAEVLTKGSDGIGPAIAMASAALSDQDMDLLTESFAEKTQVIYALATQAGAQPAPIPLTTNYDEHFALRYDEWALWLGWCVRENFTSFFDGKAAKGIVAKLQGLGPSGSKSPPA